MLFPDVIKILDKYRYQRREIGLIHLLFSDKVRKILTSNI